MGLPMRDSFETHREWWIRNHGNEPASLQAVGLYKALRNFVHPYLKSQTLDSKGVDFYPEVVESIGDMILYLWSVCHAAKLEMPTDVPIYKYLVPLEYSIGNLGTDIGRLCLHQRKTEVQIVWQSILAICYLCIVDPEDAVTISMRKLK